MPLAVVAAGSAAGAAVGCACAGRTGVGGNVGVATGCAGAAGAGVSSGALPHANAKAMTATNAALIQIARNVSPLRILLALLLSRFRMKLVHHIMLPAQTLGNQCQMSCGSGKDTTAGNTCGNFRELIIDIGRIVNPDT